MIGFVLKLHLELKNGKKVVFEGSGCQEAHVNFFQDWPYMRVSPKQLASARSIGELISLLSANVLDGDFPIFSASNPMRSDVVEGVFDAYDFVKMIQENIRDVSEIAKVVVELKEYNELHFYRRYEFDKNAQKYTGVILGTPEAAEDCYGEGMDQTISSFADIGECKIIKRKNLYLESNSDDVYYDWVGCAVM